MKVMAKSQVMIVRQENFMVGYGPSAVMVKELYV